MKMWMFKALIVCIFFTFASQYAWADVNTPKNTRTQNMDLDTKSKSMEVSSRSKPRGQLLYENHCHVCHDKSVHSRKARKAESIADIYYWVTRWQKELKLNWSPQEIEEVVEHLNSTYYHHEED